MVSAKGIMAVERGTISMLARERLLKKQGHCCAICEDLSEKLVLDHAHGTGHVRGFLCNSCNVKIGYVEKKGGVNANDPDYNKILDYLHNPPASRPIGLVFMGPLKRKVTEGNWPKRVREMILATQDYITWEEFFDAQARFHRALQEESPKGGS